MIGINTEEVLLTVATFDIDYFKVNDYVKFVDPYSKLLDTYHIGIIQAINTEAVTIATPLSGKYTVTAKEMYTGKYTMKKVNITSEGGI